MRTCHWLAAVLLLSVPTTAAPQSTNAQTLRGWVAVSPALASQSEGQEECPNVCGPIGGTGPALAVSFGAHLSPRASVVFEALIGPRREGEQARRVAGDLLELSAQHRDSLFSAGLAMALTDPNVAVSAHGVALAGVARRRTALTGVRRTSFPPSAAPYDETLTDVVPAFGGGVNVVVRLRRNVAIVPSVRAHLIVDDDPPENQPPRRGVGSLVIAGGLGVAIGF